MGWFGRGHDVTRVLIHAKLHSAYARHVRPYAHDRTTSIESPTLCESFDHQEPSTTGFNGIVCVDALWIALGCTAHLDMQHVLGHLDSQGDLSVSVLPRIGDELRDDQLCIHCLDATRRESTNMPPSLGGRRGVVRQRPREGDGQSVTYPSCECSARCTERRSGQNMPMAQVIAIANQKGGVAKTTTAITVAAALVEFGRRTLLVDLDAQGCATFSLGIDPEDIPAEGSVARIFIDSSVDPVVGLRDVMRDTDDGVVLIPSTTDLASVDFLLAGRQGRERILARALEPMRADFDHIVIDCSPSLGLTTINALVAADDVIVPLKCETLSHRGLGQLMETIDEVRQWSNPALRVAGIVPTLFDGRTSHAQAVLADLGPRYGVPIFGPIPRSVRFAEAPAVGRTILATSPTSAGARAYRSLAQALVA